MLSVIENRRSIRKYKKKDVPKHIIEDIIQAGMLAPSSKNRQPWKFIVAESNAKDEVLAVMKRGLEREKENPFLPESAQYFKGAEHTLEIMRQAPVLIFIINTLGIDIHASLNAEERIYEICNAQSVGAAIENMTLAATEYGLGSLWICDTYFAYEELCSWMDTEGELFAAMAVGYADEQPSARPRKEKAAVTEWRR